MNTSVRTTVNVLALDDFERVAQVARALNRPAAEVRRQQARADDLREAIHARLTRPDGVLIDGLDAEGKQSTHASQQANAWALAFGVVPNDQVPAVVDHIVALKTAMGVVFFRVLLDALHAAGRDDALVAALTDPTRPGYAQMLQRGATFTWESWDAPEVGDSESHGWGATVLAVLQDDVLGVHSTAPGGAALDVRAPRTSVTHADGTIATQRGPVPISWRREGIHETIDITVPVNVTATVHIDGEKPITVGSGHYVLSNVPRRASRSTSSDVTMVGVGSIVVVAAGIVWLLVRRRRRVA
jgi:alpha-L-rhamnosidase